MRHSPSIAARLQKKRQQKLQEGTILSFTKVAHPPEGFPSHPRCIGLIALQDGTKTLGELVIPEGCPPEIGQRVRPRMRLSRVSAEGLRIYDVSYEVCALAADFNPRETSARDREFIREFPGYILALTGPSGVGKSTISRLLVTMVGEVTANVPIVTTREPKEGDDSEYRYVTDREFRAMQRSGEVIAATEIPSSSEQRWYGYRAADIEAIWKAGKIPVVVTEMRLLQDLARHYGRRSILSFGLLPPGRSKRTMLSHLLHRLRSRGRDTEQHIRDRIRNAERDLAFFRERGDLFDHILVNEDLETVIALLKGHVMSVVQG